MTKANLPGVLILLCVSGPASATVSCSVSSSGVAFGAVDPVANATVTSSGNITLGCNATSKNDSSTYTVSLSTGSSGNFSSRTMTNGSYKLNYNLYKDSARTQILGDGSASTYTVSGTNTYRSSLSSTNTIPVYGSVPNNQFTIPAGSYADTLTISVSY